MSIRCNPCGGTGFKNLEQIEDAVIIDAGVDAVLKWMQEHKDHDVCVCDCCGDGDTWYGTPGEHYTNEDPPGPNGPYRSSGGLCQCH